MLHCVVPENIHTSPSMKGHWKFRGEGGLKAEISGGSGGFMGSSFPRGGRNTKKLKATHH